jgi:hypothetical protein
MVMAVFPSKVSWLANGEKAPPVQDPAAAFHVALGGG